MWKDLGLSVSSEMVTNSFAKASGKRIETAVLMM